MSARCAFLLAAPLICVPAIASVTTYADRPSFAAAAGTTRTIDFSKADSGQPITVPDTDLAMTNLGLSGVCSPSVNSYYNQVIYAMPGNSIQANLPLLTYAAGMDFGSFYGVPGNFSVRLSSGEKYDIVS